MSHRAYSPHVRKLVVQAPIQYTDRQRNRAWSLLCLSVRDEVVPHIADIEDPEQVWRTLKSLYESSGNAKKLYLKSKLHRLRMEEGSKVFDLLKEVREIMN